MPRPRSFTDNDVARAALQVLDTDGLSALTMRAVAERLGSSVMAVYRYMDSREALERSVVEQILHPVDLHVPAEAAWDERITVLLGRVRDAVTAHPEAVPLFLAHRHDSTATLRWIEATLGVLADAGFTGTGRVVAQRSIVGYLLGSLQLQRLGPLEGTGTHTMANLSAAEYPWLTETAADAATISPHEEFDSGLAALLLGLANRYLR